jgi:hypothetical protein
MGQEIHDRILPVLVEKLNAVIAAERDGSV